MMKFKVNGSNVIATTQFLVTKYKYLINKIIINKYLGINSFLVHITLYRCIAIFF